MARLVACIIIFAVAVGCSQGDVDQAKFEGVYRASKTLEAGVHTGVTVSRFAELLQAFETEISVLQGRGVISTKTTKNEYRVELGNADFELLKDYQEAATEFQSALRYWRRIVANPSDRTEYPIKLDSGNVLMMGAEQARDHMLSNGMSKVYVTNCILMKGIDSLKGGRCD